jgi:tetratricopeptide (TPR) repeat protein
MRRSAIALGVLLAAGLLLRLYHLDRWLPDFYEEATPVLRACDFWGWKSGTFDFNPHFFNYPALTFYLHFFFQGAIGALAWLSGRVDSLDRFRELLQERLPDFVLLGRAATVLCDLGTVGTAYLLGRRIGGERTGLAGALLVAGNALHARLSQYVLVDLPLALLTTLALVFMVEALEQRRMADLVRTGLCIGLASATKYTAALLLVPLGVVGMYGLAEGAGRQALARVAAAGGTALLVFAALNPFALLDFQAFLGDFSFEREHMAAGHFGYDEGAWALEVYAVELWRAAGIAGLAALAGLAMAIGRQERSRGLLWVWVLVYLGVILSWKMRADRYLLPVLPALLVLGADALVRGVQRLGGRAGAGAALTAAILYLVPQGAALARHYAAVQQPDTRIQVRHWMEEQLDPAALVVLESYTYDAEQGKGPALVLKIPLVVVHPEAATVFYDLRWYENFDYLAISSSVYERYLNQAAKFPAPVAFYQELAQHWQVEQRFESDRGTGPTVVIYRNPRPARLDQPFPQELYLKLNDMSDLAASYFLARLSGVLRQAGLVRRAGDVAEKLALIEELEPGLPRRAAIVFHELGRAAMGQGDVEGALAALGQAVELGSKNADTYLFLGSLLKEAGRREEAGQVLGQLLERQVAGTAETYAQAGRALDEMEEWRAAEELLRKAVEMGSAEARLELAWNLSMQGRLSEAETQYRLVLEQEPGSRAQFNLGLVYLVQGKVAEAGAAYALGVEKYGAAEGARVGAVENLEHLIELGIQVQAAKAILRSHWPEQATF